MDYFLDGRKADSYKKTKEVMETYIPWIKAIELTEFMSIAYDVLIINNGKCTMIDLEIEIENKMAEQLEKTGYLIRLSSDDEAKRYQVSSIGIDRVFSIIENNRAIKEVDKIDGHDLLLMWILYFQMFNMEVDSDLSTLKDSIEYIFNGYNMDLTKYKNAI